MRDSYWDTWKGIAIIAVVLIHASGSTSSFPPDSLNNEFGVVLRQIINFPVGLFIFLAGFFSARSHRPSGRRLSGTWRRIWRLAFPYLVWSSLYIALKVILGRAEVEDAPLMILNGTATTVGYFVIVMIQLSLLTPALERLKYRQLIWLLPIALVVSLGFTYSVQMVFTQSVWSGFPYYALPFFVWLPFYIGGILAGRDDETILGRVSIFGAVVAYALLVVLSIIEAEFLHSYEGLAKSQLKLTSMLATGGVCVIAMSVRNSSRSLRPTLISWIGQQSYYFYLSHIVFLGLFVNAMRKVDVLYANQMVFVILIAGMTLAACLISAAVFNRLFAHSHVGLRAMGLV